MTLEAHREQREIIYIYRTLPSIQTIRQKGPVTSMAHTIPTMEVQQEQMLVMARW